MAWLSFCFIQLVMNPVLSHKDLRGKAVWGPKRTLAAAFLCLVALVPNAMAAGHNSRNVTKGKAGKPNSRVQRSGLDNELSDRADKRPTGTTRVIVTFKPGAAMPAEFRGFDRKRSLGIINGQVLEVPNRLLKQFSKHASVVRFSYDRPLAAANYRTALTTGARAVTNTLGLTGAGVGVAVIDSGIATWHDDLTSNSSVLYPWGNQRVAAFVDFVNGRTAPYDDEGHGTHVAGIIAGNGYDSNGEKAGIAPGASLSVLKVLDAHGQGTISNIIAALDWVLANRTRYNIRVVNLSVGATITESYWTDPLTLAAKRVADAGVVVVGAAGNRGKNAAGVTQYGGITAPGNAPWVLTVGASSTNGTANRTDDTIAGFSSRGPTYLDWAAKPDLVAPGQGSVSIAAPGSTLVQSLTGFLVPGLLNTSTPAYLSLSGTSMAAPVVAGTVALMLQANPALTPNAVKAILQYTAQDYSAYNGLTEGAGFLNTVGAVRLARFFAHAQPGQPVPTQAMWGKHIIWGNHRLTGGMLLPTANAFRVGTNWGVAQADNGDNIVWGTACGDGTCDNIVWGTADGGDNIVWGTACGDNTCDNIVWGTADNGDNIVWGTDCGGDDCDNVVWGTADAGDNIVWGTADAGDNIVWGTADAGDNIVWGTADAGDNIVWGTADAGDNIVWGTADAGDNIVWGTAAATGTVWTSGTTGGTTTITVTGTFDSMTDEALILQAAQPPPPPPPPPAPTPLLKRSRLLLGGI
jgi:serine protease AprX